MAYDTKKLVTLGVLKSAIIRLRADYNAVVESSGHTRMIAVGTVPASEDAQENVLYLVYNTATARYEVYALVDDAVRLIGDSTADLANYLTRDELGDEVDTAVEEAFDDMTATDDEVAEMFDEVFAGPADTSTT